MSLWRPLFIFIFVNLYLCICVFVYVYLCLCICVFVHLNLCIRMCICICLFVFVYLCIWICEFVFVFCVCGLPIVHCCLFAKRSLPSETDEPTPFWFATDRSGNLRCLISQHLESCHYQNNFCSLVLPPDKFT